MQLVADNWKLPAFNRASVLTFVFLDPLTYNWNFFAFNWNFLNLLSNI